MNPSPDKAINDRAIDQFRRGLAVYPDDHFYRTLVDFALNRATRAAGSPVPATTSALAIPAA
ncbi:hypothetical protein V6L77_04815 [Pannonibacter sp. Pt2-lr]